MNNKDLLFFSLIIVFGGLPCLVMAFLIGKQKKYQLFSGWNPAHYSNPAAFANRVALSIFLLELSGQIKLNLIRKFVQPLL